MIGKHIRVIANFNSNYKTPLKAYVPKGRLLDCQTYNLPKFNKDRTEKFYNGWDYKNIHIRVETLCCFRTLLMNQVSNSL